MEGPRLSLIGQTKSRKVKLGVAKKGGVAWEVRRTACAERTPSSPSISLHRPLEAGSMGSNGSVQRI
jgi:hypothetical protein